MLLTLIPFFSIGRLFLFNLAAFSSFVYILFHFTPTYKTFSSSSSFIFTSLCISPSYFLIYLLPLLFFVLIYLPLFCLSPSSSYLTSKSFSSSSSFIFTSLCISPSSFLIYLLPLLLSFFLPNFQIFFFFLFILSNEANTIHFCLCPSLTFFPSLFLFSFFFSSFSFFSFLIFLTRLCFSLISLSHSSFSSDPFFLLYFSYS
ncbi:unnamed protein product [Acanthosepion pharaonis]|uniref:Uncharacterized protein n=1 Tax=Acanthosepion pharaonis TaxID=158019 RepID=A0A812C314_ACAPH|nr:unnamed protein product [Sepia pharaonis]